MAATAKAQKDLFDMSSSDEEYQPAPPKAGSAEDERNKPSRNIKGYMPKLRVSPSIVLAKMSQSEREVLDQRLKEVKEQQIKSRQERIEIASKIAAELLTKQKSGTESTLHFAGKLYKLNAQGEMEEILDNETVKGFEELQRLANKYTAETIEGQNKNQKPANLEETEYRNLLVEKKANFKSLVALLNNRHRNVSAIFKSKIDWKKYTSSNQLEKQFEQNRKDGFIEKQKFLVNSTARQKELGQGSSVN
jgi:hypothetical protein